MATDFVMVNPVLAEHTTALMSEDKQVHKRRKVLYKTPEFVSTSSSDEEPSKCVIRKKVTVPRSTPPERKYPCEKCEYVSTNASNLTRHTRTHEYLNHNQSSGSLPCPEPGCLYFAKKLKTLQRHHSSVHNIFQEIDNLTFQTDQDLRAWLTDLQMTEFVKYVRQGGIYYCHRSGQFKQPIKSDRKRRLKKDGSIKSNCVCLSRIVLTKSGDRLNVTYYKNHTGHLIKPGCIGVTSPEKRKRLLASKIVPVPTLPILEQAQDDGVENGIRIIPVSQSLTTSTDIQNVRKKFHLDSAIRLHPDDIVSLDADPDTLRETQQSEVQHCHPKQLSTDSSPAPGPVELVEADTIFTTLRELATDQNLAQILLKSLKRAQSLMEIAKSKTRTHSIHQPTVTKKSSRARPNLLVKKRKARGKETISEVTFEQSYEAIISALTLKNVFSENPVPASTPADSGTGLEVATL